MYNKIMCRIEIWMDSNRIIKWFTLSIYTPIIQERYDWIIEGSRCLVRIWSHLYDLTSFRHLHHEFWIIMPRGPIYPLCLINLLVYDLSKHLWCRAQHAYMISILFIFNNLWLPTDISSWWINFHNWTSVIALYAD